MVEQETSSFETLRWRDQRIELIDQRLLPGRIEYPAFDSAAGVAEAIRCMVVRGAPAIGCAAAYGVAVEAHRLASLPPDEFASGLEAAFTVLSQSRPTAVNLFWALDRMRGLLDSLQGQAPVQAARRLLEEADAIKEEDLAINRRMGEHGAALLPDHSRVLTHCNAGALATAGHGTALGVIRSAVNLGKTLMVYADETRPLLQGARLTAWELVQEGIPVTLIADNMCGHLMSHGEIDVVVVGADRVAANGDVANKIGTYMVAVLARHHRIPFYVACPLSTIDRSIDDGSRIPIEERGAAEVRGFGGVEWAPAGVKIRNPAFDVTPAGLVTALITESGVVSAPDRGKIAELFQPPDRT